MSEKIDFEGIDAETIEFYIEEKISEREIAEGQIELNELNLKKSLSECDELEKSLLTETDAKQVSLVRDELEAKREWQEYIIDHSNKLREAIATIDAVLERLRT